MSLKQPQAQIKGKRLSAFGLRSCFLGLMPQMVQRKCSSFRFRSAHVEPRLKCDLQSCKSLLLRVSMCCLGQFGLLKAAAGTSRVSVQASGQMWWSCDSCHVGRMGCCSFVIYASGGSNAV